jgi:DNA-binding MarR family transcriptional regulator
VNRTDEVLVALRRIMRAVDIRSRHLSRASGLTAPQWLLLRALASNGSVGIGQLAREIHLSQATTTDIVDRLERRGLVSRARSTVDRRRVQVALLPEGARLVEESPTPLQRDFTDRFERLNEWEQTQILSCLQRLGGMMDAQRIDAAPMLEIEPIVQSPNLSAVEPASGSDVEPGGR